MSQLSSVIDLRLCYTVQQGYLNRFILRMSPNAAIKTLGRFIKPDTFSRGFGARLPEAYKKFYKEWKLTAPTAVHYIPEVGRWKRDEVTGEVHPIQNVPIPTRLPLEARDQLWGGDAIVQGFRKKHKIYKRRFPRFWIPVLRRSVIYSEVLDKYMSVVVTIRALDMINENYGLDHYLLKTPACDLQTLLSLHLKRKILQELEKGCPTLANQPEKQKEVYNRYKQYLAAYTPEEIEWYGYSFNQAVNKLKESIEAANKPIPLKVLYRSELIEKLKAAGIKEAQETEGKLGLMEGSWINKINPFSKKSET